MDVAKITQNTVKLVQSATNQGAKISTEIPESAECCEKLMGTLSCLAANAVSNIKSAKKPDIPEFIYHITSQENFEKILRDKKIIVSDIEAGGCNGVYFVDKDNFLQKWLGRKMLILKFLPKCDIGEALMKWTCKGSDPVAIKIPTSSLELTKLRFRPFVEGMNKSLEGFDADNCEMIAGLPLSDLAKYAKTNEPLEFVYMDEIPIDIFSDWSVAKFSENVRDMISELFG